jgi:multiple sugar transport system substrate-binding protein
VRLKIVPVFIFLLALIGTTACDKEEVPTLNPNDSYTITIMEDKDIFMQKFGKIILTKYPNITLLFASPPAFEAGTDRLQAMTQFLHQMKPDILFLSYKMFAQLSQAKQLLDLTPFIKADKFDIENFHQAVIELLHGLEPDRLYGLSPTFIKSGIFYNKELFDKYNVKYPANKLTWEDISRISQQFPLNLNDDRKLVGLYIDNLYGGDLNLYTDRMLQLASFEQVPILNTNGTTLLMDDPKWKTIWQFLKSNFQTGAFVKVEDSNRRDLFLAGEAAMALTPNVYIQLLERNMNGKWGVVTEPVSKEKPSHSYTVSVREVYSIPITSNSPAIAWEILKFMHSEEVTNMMADSSSFGHLLFTRESAPRIRGTIDYSVFYELDRWFEPQRGKTTPSFLETFIRSTEQELKAVIEEDKPIDQALKDLQENGQNALKNL